MSEKQQIVGWDNMCFVKASFYYSFGFIFFPYKSFKYGLQKSWKWRISLGQKKSRKIFSMFLYVTIQCLHSHLKNRAKRQLKTKNQVIN